MFNNFLSTSLVVILVIQDIIVDENKYTAVYLSRQQIEDFDAIVEASKRLPKYV